MAPYRNRNGKRAAGVLLAAAVLHASGCLYLVPSAAYKPQPGRSASPFDDTFGYMSIGIEAHSDFFGEVEGVSPGTGWTMNFPLAPGPVIVAALVAAVAAGGGGSGGNISGSGGGGGDDALLDNPLFWRAGLEDPDDAIVSDVSFDVTLGVSWHDDRLHGGLLRYTSALVGVRLGGPRMFNPRYYLTGGYGIYGFDYSSGARADALVVGPYAGFGLEFLLPNGQAIAADFKTHFYYGDDDDGVPVDGGARIISLLYSWYW